MDCSAANERLLELLYGEPQGADHADLVAHVERCKMCSMELAGLRRTQESLNQWTTSPATTARLGWHANGLRSARASSWRGALVGAAAMLALSLGTLASLGTVSRETQGVTLRLPFGKTDAKALGPSESTEQYLLLLHSSGEDQPLDSPHEQQLVAEYSAWAKKLHQQGQLVSAEKLSTDDALMLTRSGESVRGDLMQFGALPTHVTGFFLVRAGSFEHAQSIARECPHLQRGGGVELRRIEKTP